MNSYARKTALAALLLTTAITLSACGSDDTASPGASGMPMATGTSPSSDAGATGTPAAGAHGDADVAFATDMIPHHRQAVQMADLAATRAGSQGVKDLAAKIRGAQAPEISQMSGWLRGWGAAVPAETGMGAMGDMSMDNGMMSDEDLTAMSGQTGSAFDVMFLKGMTAHHRGAIAMAQAELKSGSNAEAKRLAQSIISSQGEEITAMATLLKQAGS